MIVISAPEVNPMQLGKLKLRQYELPYKKRYNLLKRRISLILQFQIISMI